MNTIFESLQQFWNYTGFASMTWQHLVMIVIGIAFITVAIKKDWEPLLLVPIGFGMIIGNIPFIEGLKIGIYEQGSVMNILYQGVQQGWYPPLIFLGIGAMLLLQNTVRNLSPELHQRRYIYIACYTISPH